MNISGTAQEILPFQKVLSSWWSKTGYRVLFRSFNCKYKSEKIPLILREKKMAQLQHYHVSCCSYIRAGEHPREPGHLRQVGQLGPTPLRHRTGRRPAHLRHLVLQRPRPAGLYRGYAHHPAAYTRAHREREPAHFARREPRGQRQLLLLAGPGPPRRHGRPACHPAGAGTAVVRHGDGDWRSDGDDGGVVDRHSGRHFAAAAAVLLSVS